MAVLNYDGTNLNSLASSGFFRRFYSEFQDNSGQVWRIEILDSTTTNDGFSFSDSDPQYFVLGPDGFTLTWDGKSDTAHSAFIPSNLTFDFLINDIKLKQLASVLGSTVDERFAVGLFKHVPNASSSSTSTTVQDPSPTGYWAPEWFGIIIPEDVKVLDNEPNSFMRIKANDGLAILNSVQYIADDGSLFENRDSLAKTIARCLSKIPTSTLWGFNEYDGSTTPNTAIDNGDTALVIPAFFREYLYQYSPNYHKDTTSGVISSPVHLTSVLSPTWYDLSSSTDHFGGMLTTKEALSCAGVLKHILQVFQSRLFLSGGSWNFQNPGAIVEDATPQVFEWVSKAKMVDGTAPESSTLTTNKIDFDDNLVEPLKGLNESYLFPIYQALSKHKKGGAGILLQAPYPVGWVMGVNEGYITDEYPWYTVLYHDSSNISTLANDDVVIEDSTVININAGRLRLNETGFGPQAIDQDAVGMFAVFEITIKVGAYYLKRDLAFSGAGDVVNIQRNAAADYDQQFFEQSGNVEWTTTASTYSLVFPFENCDGAAIMPQGSGDNAVNRIGGLHVARRTGNNDHEFMFRTGIWAEDFGTQMAGMSAPLNWSLPELPSNAAGHTGISFSAYLDYYKRDGTQFDASATSWLQSNQPGKIENFRITAGLENSNADALFTATTDENRAILDLGESILGGTYNAGPSVNGCLFTDSVNAAGVNAFPINTNWASVGLPAVAQNIHQLNVNERCMERYDTHPIKSGTFSFNVGGYMPAWNNVTRKALPELRQIWGITMGNLISSCTPMTLTWTATSRTMDASGIVMSYDRATPITEATNLNDLKDGRDPGGPGPVADPNDPIVGVWNGKGPASWITDDGTTGIVSLKCSDGASGSSTVTLQGTNDINIQTDHVAIGNNTSSIASNGSSISSLTSTVNSNSNDIDAIQDVLKSDTGGGGKGIYSDTGKSQAQSHLSLDATNARVQAGENTAYNAEENSPGILTMSVQAGGSGSEVAVTAITVQGDSSFQNAITTFNQPVVFGANVSGGSLLKNVVEDTTPQLGGNLDVNGKNINGAGVIIAGTGEIKLAQDSGNNDIVIDPAGTGAIVLKSNTIRMEGVAGVDVGGVKFYEAPLLEGNYVALNAPMSIAADVNWILPGTDGSSGQAMSTNGSGTLAWTSFITSQNPVTEGTLAVKSIAALQGKVTIYDLDNSNYVIIKTPSALTGNYTLTLPPDDGAANQVLKTDGSGVTSWVDQSGGESGWFNSTTLMKVMPTEFMANSNKSLMIDDSTTDNVHVKCSDGRGSIDAYAIKAIPSGYKATHVHVYGTNITSTSNSVTVRAFDQTDGDLTNTTTGAMNSNIDISDITSGATANILIKVELNSVNGVGQDDLFGADITIAAV